MSEALTVADYEEVLQEHRRLVRELDVILNGISGAAKQASLCDIVSQVRRAGLVAVTEQVSRALALGTAIERAAAELPDGYELRIEAELHAGTVALYDRDCDRLEEWLGDTLGEQADNAISYAIEQTARERS